MKKLLVRLKPYLPIFYIIITLLIIILLLMLFCLIPTYYNWVFGEKVVQLHINEIIGNKTNDAEIAGTLMQWVKENVVYPNNENKVNILDLDFYRVHNKTKFFWREGPASWIIKTKMGRCGEDANYFVGVMTQLGYKARKVKPVGKNPWDHAWAEYYNSEGIKIVLDPSSNQIISPNLNKWVENKSFTKIEAIDLKGNKEDVTKEYTG